MIPIARAKSAKKSLDSLFISERKQFRDRPQCGLLENLQTMISNRCSIAEYRHLIHFTSLPVPNILLKLTTVQNGSFAGPNTAKSGFRRRCS